MSSDNLNNDVANMTVSDDSEGGAGPSIVPTSQKATWGSYIKQLMTASGDLASLSAPAFLLSGISVLELEEAYCCYPEVFADINRATDPSDRMLKVVRWWLASLWANFGEPFVSSGNSVKKPYNPILGEQLHCRWEDSNPDSDWKTVVMTAEQVSHHPPVSAYYYENAALGMYVNGSILTKTKFRGTAVKVENVGEVILFLKQHNEQYRITYPEMYLRGIISGKIFTEITGETYIKSSNGLVGHINHIAKGWFLGDYHGIKGSVYNEDEEPLFTLSGKWTDKTYATSSETKEQQLLSDVTSDKAIHPKYLPPQEQGELESPKVWASVTAALKAEDYSKATVEKNAIEEKQRALRRQRETEKSNWTPHYFHPTADSKLADYDIKDKDKVSYWTFNGFPTLKEDEQA